MAVTIDMNVSEQTRLELKLSMCQMTIHALKAKTSTVHSNVLMANTCSLNKEQGGWECPMAWQKGWNGKDLPGTTWVKLSGVKTGPNKKLEGLVLIKSFS